MSIEIKQQLKLSQQLVMTPQLQQAIKLLQLSRMELVDLVREEMMENPVLEDALETGQEQTREREELGTDGEGRASRGTAASPGGPPPTPRGSRRGPGARAARPGRSRRSTGTTTSRTT